MPDRQPVASVSGSGRFTDNLSSRIDFTMIAEQSLDAFPGGTRTVFHWYDFLCPFCYVGQSRTAILLRNGFEVVELPFQAHPDISPGGIEVGPRHGPMYVRLEREAAEAGLPLNWPPRLPDSRLALTAAEWIRQHRSDAFRQFSENIFRAHFVLGEDIGDHAIIDDYASRLGIDLDALHAAIADGSAMAEVTKAELLGRRHGVRGTPAWLVRGGLIEGLLPAAEFERLSPNG
jgi:predicted DsbA family dithiol-disulfide isomerase